ncbi:MAG: transglycosylase domain-containing protein [Rhizobiaceae bacterium]
MARAKKGRRIEPTFENGTRRRSGGRLSAREDDRLVSKPVQKRRKPGRKKQRKTARSRSGLFGLMRRLAYWSLVLGIWAGIAGVGVVAWYGAKMPSATSWAIPDRPPNVKIVSVDGSLIANRGMTGGEAIGLHRMSPYIPQAVVAIEDRRFYSHFGIDPIGLARAMATNLIKRRWVQGGSTLTQQLAKNLFLKPDRTLERKVQEVLLAFWIEHKYTKEQILEMYLNRVYFGSGAYGVEAASRRYFDKPARDVSLAEAALLAGLLKAPSRLSPARDPKAASERAQLVLAAMREQNMIGDKEMTLAISAPATRAAAFWTGSEHYVADRIMEDLPELIGDVRDDIIVDTTVDLTLQKLAENSIRRLIADEGAKRKVSQGALVSIDASGAVRAMVGGFDYANSQFDRASEARRQPGSAFKPFVYVAALEHGLTPNTVRNDAPVRFGKWAPDNYGGKYYGRVTLAKALAMSLNSVAAQLTMEVGPAAVADTAHRMGIKSELQANASIALGTSEVTLLELTAAYVPFANGGYRPPVHFVRRITTTSGKVLYEYRHDGVPRVMRDKTVGMMNQMMAQTLVRGTARKADFGWPAAGKTGTSQKSRDAWFVGYTSNLTTGVWFGNDDGTPMKNVTGGSLPAIAWKEFMIAAHEGVPLAALPGAWSPSGNGDDTPVPRPRETVARSGSLADDRGFAAAPEKTSAVRRPVPPADVGGGTGRKTTILDIIFGRDR